MSPKKTLRVVSTVFLVIGLGMLAGASVWFANQRQFVASASHATGTVIELVQRTSSSSSDDGQNSPTWAPVVRFDSADGQTHRLVSKTSSNPPAYTRGEQVDVLYQQDKPESGVINGWFSLWGGMTIVGGLGLVFALIGAVMIGLGLRGGKRKQLLHTGQRVEARFQSVALNDSLSINGRSPFQILCQWQDPQTSKMHVFASENLWYDPTDVIQSETFQVYLQPGNPKHYYMDISALPAAA